MKVLRWLMYILIAVLVAAVVLGLIGPKTYLVSRSIVIDAGRQEVFGWIDNFDKINRWNPWVDLDPNMTTSLKGTDGQVGVEYSWQGNDKVGKGSQTIMEIVPGELVGTRLKFIEPMASEADVTTTVQDTSGGTKVTWAMHGENGFISRIFMNFMNMDAMIGPDFEKGMQKLKTLVEANKSVGHSGYQILESDFPGQLYAGIRKEIPISDLTAFFTQTFGLVMEKAGSRAVGMPCSFTYVWDETNRRTDIAGVVPVSGQVEGLTSFNLPASRMLSIDYYGAYDAIGSAHAAMEVYMKDHHLEFIPPVVEAYLSDPGSEPDTSKWLTQVRYFVRDLK
ncbi:MAG: SRPBCC family protein [Saprospiraceae bacterium]|nr:SRPBCC family protein [Saprospiraceae bacterium]MCB9319816.1 SRPBCC family protein [Lewinellaceae bacterium]